MHMRIGSAVGRSLKGYSGRLYNALVILQTGTCIIVFSNRFRYGISVTATVTLLYGKCVY